jgi:hypothetical protein
MGGRKVQTGLAPVVTLSLKDADADRVARSHGRAITELQGLIAAGARLVENIELPDATDVPVHHGLGRPPRWVGPSPARGTALTGGAVLEQRSASFDRNDVVVLRAVGFGATITLDLLVL